MIANIAIALVVLVAIEHVYFLYLEMFAWTKPSTRKVFGTTPEFAAESRVLAANQGLYNGFLAVGLLIGAFKDIHHIATLFLYFVIVAAIFGSATTGKPRIAYVQGLPALLALIVITFAL